MVAKGCVCWEKEGNEKERDNIKMAFSLKIFFVAKYSRPSCFTLISGPLLTLLASPPSLQTLARQHEQEKQLNHHQTGGPQEFSFKSLFR